MVDSISGGGPLQGKRLNVPAANGAEGARGAGAVARSEGSPAQRAGQATTASGVSSFSELSAAPPVDTSRVNRLRDAISNGSYQPDPERIAAAMIQSELGAKARS
jgi:negative regulator of flagellin synthesis FlgM